MNDPLAGLDMLDEETAEAAQFLQQAPEGMRSVKKRNRRWEAQNAPTSYRLDPEINERIKEIKVTLLEEDQFQTTTSAIAEALLWRGLAAWDAGEELEIWGREIAPKAGTYSRSGDSG